jgi:hypothetical protein
VEGGGQVGEGEAELQGGGEVHTSLVDVMGAKLM